MDPCNNKDFTAKLARVRARVDAAAYAAGRDPRTVTLVAVAKAQPVEAVTAAWRAGQRDFAESYLQEAVPHIAAAPEAVWHFIGRIQANKTRAVAARFAWVHAVDRLRVAERLSAHRPADMAPLQVCIQLNLDGEASKGGVDEASALELARGIAVLPKLRLRGLMAIPREAHDPARQRAAFAAVRRVYDALRAEGFALDTLSMGMSGDFEAAIAEGATIVRIGTALFGPRA